MPQVRARISGGVGGNGGILGYPLKRLWEEVAFIAYHFHWNLEDILNLEHPDRERLIREISAINRRMNETSSPSRGVPLQTWLGL